MSTDTLNPSPVLSDSAVKFRAVAEMLRQRIIKDLRPSTRLRSFTDMANDYGVSRTVLRQAVEELKRDGFIYSVDRKGLFVADRPPHLTRFALAFGGNPSQPSWTRFFTAMKQEALAIQQGGQVSFEAYYDLAGGPGVGDFDRLWKDITAHRLAGLILAPGTHELATGGLLATASVPKVFVCGDAQAGRTPSVSVDDAELCDRMVQSLRERGRDRIAVIAACGNIGGQIDFLTRHGVPTKPHWLQTVGSEDPSDARRLVALLMDYPHDQRANGLIILDDNLTEHSVGGLLEVGVRVGQDVDVVAHCNWPWPVASAVPVLRVGFHARHIITGAVRAIELERNHQKLACNAVHAPALFETEISRPWLPAAFG